LAQEFAASGPNRAPTHPGAILREDVLPALNMTITDFAIKLGVTRQQVHRILAEESDISTEMALRLGKICGNGPQLWLGMQEARNLWLARAKLADELERIPNLNAEANAA